MVSRKRKVYWSLESQAVPQPGLPTRMNRGRGVAWLFSNRRTWVHSVQLALPSEVPVASTVVPSDARKLNESEPPVSPVNPSMTASYEANPRASIE